MKGNILKESEKKRITEMHTSHKNQKLDDEARRLSKLFGYTINESVIRGYLINEGISIVDTHSQYKDFIKNNFPQTFQTFVVRFNRMQMKTSVSIEDLVVTMMACALEIPQINKPEKRDDFSDEEIREIDVQVYKYINATLSPENTLQLNADPSDRTKVYTGGQFTDRGFIPGETSKQTIEEIVQFVNDYNAQRLCSSLLQGSSSTKLLNLEIYNQKGGRLMGVMVETSTKAQFYGLGKFIPGQSKTEGNYDLIKFGKKIGNVIPLLATPEQFEPASTKIKPEWAQQAIALIKSAGGTPEEITITSSASSDERTPGNMGDSTKIDLKSGLPLNHKGGEYDVTGRDNESENASYANGRLKSVLSVFQQAFPGITINQQAVIQTGGKNARFVKVSVKIKQPDDPGQQDVFIKMEQIVSNQDQNVNLTGAFQISTLTEVSRMLNSFAYSASSLLA